MQIIKLEHADFDLIIECNNLFSAFNKSKQRQSQIFSATNYSTNEGNISIYNFESNQLEHYFNLKSHPLIFENKDYFCLLLIVGISD